MTGWKKSKLIFFKGFNICLYMGSHTAKINFEICFWRCGFSKFARHLATGVFKSLCTFFHFPDSFFLGSSFFLPLPFILLTRARTGGRPLGAMARESPLRAAGARGVFEFVTCSAPFSCTAASHCCFFVCLFSFCTVPFLEGNLLGDSRPPGGRALYGTLLASFSHHFLDLIFLCFFDGFRLNFS